MKKNKAEEGVGGVSELRGQQGAGGRGEVRDGGAGQRVGAVVVTAGSLQLWGVGWGGGS